MKKSTDDLMKVLKSSDSVDEYFDKCDNEIFFGDLHELINYFMVKKNIEKKNVVKQSGLNRTYAYEILSGTNKNISRDKVIMLCFGLSLNVEEAQQMLKKSGYAELYARDTRDAIILFSLENKIPVIDTNIKLADFNLKILE